MEEMRYITCPNCSGTLGVPHGFSAVRCPYCGYNIVLQEQTVGGIPVYVLPRRIRPTEVPALYLEELAKQVGVPPDIEDAVKRAKISMILVPLFIFEVSAQGEIRYRKYHGDVAFIGSVAVSADPRFRWIDGITVPAAGRVPFDPSIYRDARIIALKDLEQARIDATRRAEDFARRRLREIAVQRGSAPYNVTVSTTLRDIVYYPIYHIEYAKMHAALDAVDGKVLFGMYPPNGTVRAAATGGIIAIISAGILGSFVGSTFYPLLVGIAGALPLARVAVLPANTFGEKASILSMNQIIASLSEG